VLLAFLLGLFLGRKGGNSEPLQTLGASHGSVSRLSNIIPRLTSHADAHGRQITKQQLIDPFVVPNLAGLSVATLLPNQRISLHQHSTMHEFFYVLSGSGVIQVNGIDNSVEPGSFVHVAPGETHSFWVPSDSQQSMKMFVSGIAVGPKPKPNF
jgi:quercetin dioxygenase-like cupin family protein